jgi:HEAT repeat protein
LTAVGESKALFEAASLLGDLDPAALTAFSECCALVGATATRALLPLLHSEHETAAFTRARDLVQSFGDDAVPHVAMLVEHDQWYVQRNAAQLLGAARSTAAVPPLQALLRRRDPRVLHHTVVALAGIPDPAAARALQTVLRTASGDSRVAVVQALVSEGDLRVVPLLGRILSESDPFGEDHQVVLDMLGAVRQLGDERAVPAVTEAMRKKRLFGGRKARAFKTAAVRALLAIGTPRAEAALDDAKKTGDRLLKKVVREAGR